MNHVMVRYRVKPDRAAENADLVRAVYAQLHRTQPDGFRYATYQLDDGVSFLHIASYADGVPNPLTELEAFQRFQSDIADRCDEPPALRELREIGAYR